jgi:hypothetical protein
MKIALKEAWKESTRDNDDDLSSGNVDVTIDNFINFEDNNVLDV